MLDLYFPPNNEGTATLPSNCNLAVANMTLSVMYMQLLSLILQLEDIVILCGGGGISHGPVLACIVPHFVASSACNIHDF